MDTQYLEIVLFVRKSHRAVVPYRRPIAAVQIICAVSTVVHILPYFMNKLFYGILFLDCEKNGKVYGNGEKIIDAENPCRVCYCQGGEITCR